ncbi:MAG: hypothetical protein KTR14_08965 [Vampirovibrio sp.]|nr:hypothetical protein [Vampirovibrio sp.]
MRNAIALATGLMLLAAPLMADAKDAVKDGVDVSGSESDLCSVCWEKGSFTESNPTGARIATLPLRAVTGAVGMPVGAVGGFGKRFASGAEWVSDNTFGNIVDEDGNATSNTIGAALKTPFLVPAALVGYAIVPTVGGVVGLAEGAVHGTAKGFMYPDKL